MYWGMLGRYMATLSPCLTFSLVSAVAKWSTVSLSSWYVSVLPMKWMAGCVGCFSAAVSSSSCSGVSGYCIVLGTFGGQFLCQGLGSIWGSVNLGCPCFVCCVCLGYI